MQRADGDLNAAARSGQPEALSELSARWADRDLISGHHQGQRRQRPHQQAGQMTAPWQIQLAQITTCSAGAIHR